MKNRTSHILFVSLLTIAAHVGCGDDDSLSRERIINIEAEADDGGETTQLASARVVDEPLEFPFEVRLPDINILAPSTGEQRAIESMEVVIQPHPALSGHPAGGM